MLCVVDDASGQIFLQLTEAEDPKSVLSFWDKYIEFFGIPAKIYTDFHTILIITNVFLISTLYKTFIALPMDRPGCNLLL
ncbi:MAG: hypothetical protein QME58_11985 [Bacteroidota bacterium]|nr:hypothetical protein [Bacteroidota bacterium]